MTEALRLRSRKECADAIKAVAEALRENRTTWAAAEAVSREAAREGEFDEELWREPLEAAEAERGKADVKAVEDLAISEVLAIKLTPEEMAGTAGPGASLEQTDNEEEPVAEAVPAPAAKPPCFLLKSGAAAQAKTIEAVAEPLAVPEEEEEAEPQPEIKLGKSIAVIPPPPPEPASRLMEAVDDVNRKHAVISNLGGKCVIMEWVQSNLGDGLLEISYQAFTTFCDRYSNRYVQVAGENGRIDMVPIARYWLAHPQRQQYEGIDLVSGGDKVLPGNKLNLWRGWGVTPKAGDWSLMHEHIYEVLADGNEEFGDYIVLWAAWIIQNPDVPPEVALVLRGGKGSGKGAFGRCLMKIFGQHALQIHSHEHLAGKHNAHLQDKLFLFADEAFWGGDKAAERVLKGVITERVMMIEPKNINAFQWKNRLAVYIAANEGWVVPASHDERRYAVNNVSERVKQNRDYFRPLFAEIENGGAAAMLFELMNWRLGDWHPRDGVPQTVGLIEQKSQSLTGLEQWYVEKLSFGELPLPEAGNPRFALSRHLFEDMKRHSPKNKYITETEFGRFLKGMGCEHRSTGRARGWVFPPLADARVAWETHCGSWTWADCEATDWGVKPKAQILDRGKPLGG